MQAETIEWSARAKKYKYELVRTAQKVHALRKELSELREQFNKDEAELSLLQEKKEDIKIKIEDTQLKVKDELVYKDQVIRELNFLKRNSKQLIKDKKALMEEITDLNMKIKTLEGEVDLNEKKFKEVGVEKIKLNQETNNILKERLKLEMSTKKENGNTELLKREIDDIRQSLQDAWIETKKLDHIRSIKLPKSKTGEPSWFIARSKSVGRQGQRINDRKTCKLKSGYSKSDY